uniref:Uncharacterized protein n=1 Tax=Physcomitrium patens TaxID=3218 RepID=A0A2K1K8M2_PHYPA|nr:hypothetical protein PHYPA_012018 [Physcomitrium patens]
MAPTTAGCCQLLQAPSHEPIEMESGRRRLTLDSWVCLPMLRPVRTTSSIAAQLSSPAPSSCTTQKDLSLAKPMTLDVSFIGVDETLSRESCCETPKSKEHRIPEVDVTFCPPAPRKPRAMARRRRMQPTSFFNTLDFENFLSQHKVQVSS